MAEPAARPPELPDTASPVSGPADGTWPGGTTGATGPTGPTGPTGLPGAVHLTMPVAAWAGNSGNPGQTTGLGPFDAEACRDLGTTLAAHPDTRYCLTLTDRHGHAVAYGCCNLQPICRGDHQAKQAPGWHLDQPEPGTLTWTRPHGRRYPVTPEPYPA